MASVESFDRAAALQEFEDSKIGVRGLVESGRAANTIPTFFRHPVLRPRRLPTSATALAIPIVDLSLPRDAALASAASAARDWGFFQVTGHGLSQDLLDRSVSAMRAFHELPPEVRSQYYSRDVVSGVNYLSNIDIYRSGAASWRDTVQIRRGLNAADPDRIPEVLREAMVAWDEGATEVARTVLRLLSKGLGLPTERLVEGESCGEARMMAGHYYPPCPEPERTVGTAEHTDPGVLAVVLQNGVGELQVKRSVGEEQVWVDVEPVPGALVINVGDLLQIMSNDEYKSVEHRVLANSDDVARVSIAIFFNPGKQGDLDLYGPLPELTSPDRPAHYRKFTMPEFIGNYFNKQLRSKPLVEHFKL